MSFSAKKIYRCVLYFVKEKYNVDLHKKHITLFYAYKRSSLLIPISGHRFGTTIISKKIFSGYEPKNTRKYLLVCLLYPPLLLRISVLLLNIFVESIMFAPFVRCSLCVCCVLHLYKASVYI